MKTQNKKGREANELNESYDKENKITKEKNYEKRYYIK